MEFNFKTYSWKESSNMSLLNLNSDVFIFCNGAWDAKFGPKFEKKLDPANVVKSLEKYSNMFANAVKIFVAYPDCHSDHAKAKDVRALNSVIKNHLRDKKDWTFFQIAVPHDGRNCENFHVRYEWAKLEAQILSNALCDREALMK